MGTNQPFDLIGSFDESYEPEFDPQMLVNLFVDDDPQGKNGKAIFQTPGLSLENGIKFGGDKKGRALYIFNNHLYAIVGEKVLAVNDSLHFNEVGTINTQVGHVGLADNGTELLIVDGTGGWIWNPTASSFTKITAGGFPDSPTDAAILGSRFVVCKAESNKLHFSEIEDGLTWNALDEFAITAQPDFVVGVRRLNDRLFIMGKRITEVWYDAGEPVLPYRRSDVLPYGCAAVGSISEAFGALCWLSKTDSGTDAVVLSTGTLPTPVSSESIMKEFQRYSIVFDATSFIYRNEQGHVLYQINFTNANKSWAFDLNEKRWLRLEYNSVDRHLAEDHAFFLNKHYVLDYLAPNLYEMSNDHVTDNSVNIRRIRVTPMLYTKSQRRMLLNSIIFDLKQGVGADSGIEADPKLRLCISRDGGISYGNELSAPIGRVGERTYRTQFYRLGQSDSFVFKILYDNDTPFVLLAATVNVNIESQEGL